MEFIKQHQKLLLALLFIALYAGFFNLANKAIKDESKKVSVRESGDDKVVLVKPADVTLEVIAPGYFNSYSLRMENQNTIGDLIEELREESNLTYEQISYRTETKIVLLNGIASNEENIWNVYDEGTLINDWSRHKLDDNNLYQIKLEKK